MEEENEKLRKQIKQEQLLKAQAVNKLAEIMNRKDMNINNSVVGKGKNKMSSTDFKRKEKECRKLQQELSQVIMSLMVEPFYSESETTVGKIKNRQES